MVGLILIALGVLAFSLLSHRIERSMLTLPIAFTLFGWLIGRDGFDLLSLSVDHEIVHLLAEITLILVLFSDASRINLSAFIHDYKLPMRMLFIGMPLTILFGAAIAYWVSPEAPWTMAFLVAAILTPTDAALGQTVVTSPQVPERVRRAINVESGLNDGIALPVVMIFALLTSKAFGGLGEDAPTNLWLFSLMQVTLGPLVGVLIGYVSAKLLNIAIQRDWIAGAFQGIAFLSIAGLSYCIAEVVGGNGFISAFVAGLIFGSVVQTQSDYLDEFMESEGQLFTLITFLVFGAVMVPLGLEHATWKTVVLACLYLTVVRMLPIAIACIGMNLKLPTKLFLGWFGPRGLASILFALLIIERFPIPGGEEVLACVVLTVLISIVAHGVSALPLANIYGNWAKKSEPEQ